MRGMLAGLPSAAPVVLRLPAIYQEDELLGRFVAAFDDLLAPVLATLDDLAAYVDPALAPEDFLEWLADWVGVEWDDSWPVGQRRLVVAGAADMHRRRGTVQGVADAVRLAVGGRVEVVVEDSGGAGWSERPGGRLPGRAPAGLHVRVTVLDDLVVDERRVDAVVARAKPAHVPHTLEIEPAGAADRTGGQ